ncbi:MAG: hypothetical protein Kow00108_14780 [Calditrichia bacterium]
MVDTNKNNSELFETNIGALIRYVLKKKLTIMLITSAFAISSIVYALVATHWFTAYVTILPNSSSAGNLLGQYSGVASMLGINLGQLGEEDQMVYPDIITSNYVLDELLQKKFYSNVYKDSVQFIYLLGMEPDTTKDDWQYFFQEEVKKKIREELIYIKIDDETGILYFEIQVPEDAELSASAANYIVYLLDKFNAERRHNKAREERIFIEENIEKVYDKMSQLEEKLVQFEIKNLNNNSPHILMEHDKLKLELQLQRDLYFDLKKQLQFTRLEEIRQSKTFDVLDYAKKPHKRSFPRRALIVILSTVFGFMISIIVVVFQKTFSDFKGLMSGNKP